MPAATTANGMTEILKSSMDPLLIPAKGSMDKVYAIIGTRLQ